MRSLRKTDEASKNRELFVNHPYGSSDRICCKIRPYFRLAREIFDKLNKKLGFEGLPSSANFVFAKHPDFSGEEIYLKLREKGILVRHFTSKRICEFNRITIGSAEEMQKLVEALQQIVKGE